MKRQRIRARDERSPAGRQVDHLRGQGSEQSPRARCRGIKGDGGRRQASRHLGPVEIGYEAIVRGQGKRERFHHRRIGHLEGKPHVGGSIQVFHRHLQVRADTRHARGRRGQDCQPTGGRIADQLEEARETRGSAGHGRKFDLIGAGGAEVGQNEIVVSRGESSRPEGIDERAPADKLHDHGAIDPEAEAVVRIDVECPGPWSG